jgi:hypothetical protein
VFLQALVLILCTASAASAETSFEKDILPFGWPLDLGGDERSKGRLLSESELLDCLARYEKLSERGGQLSVERAQINVAEATAGLLGEPPLNLDKGTTGDVELDRHLDALEDAEPTLEERIVSFITRRQEQMAETADFVRECDLRSYRIQDVRKLTTR